MKIFYARGKYMFEKISVLTPWRNNLKDASYLKTMCLGTFHTRCDLNDDRNCKLFRFRL